MFLDMSLNSGKRVSNAWVICLEEKNSFAKAEVMLHNSVAYFVTDKDGLYM